MKPKNREIKVGLSHHNAQSVLITLCMVLLPQLFYMPILLVVLMSATWGYFQYVTFKTGHFFQVKQRGLQYCVVLLGLAIVYLQYKTLFGVEAGCAFLSLILLGKAFEVKSYRDAIVFFNVALFVCASSFLHGQGILIAIAVFVGVVSCLYGMYQLQSHDDTYEEVAVDFVDVKKHHKLALSSVFKLLGFAAPLMIVLFLFIPRIPPLWSLPQAGAQAKTGMSDSLNFGDIAHLSQSSELAFRVVFSNWQQLPPASKLYWRAAVLDHFNGEKWTASPAHTVYPTQISQQNPTFLPPIYRLSEQTQQKLAVSPYQIILEPTGRKWVYALDYSLAKPPVLMKSDASLQLSDDVNRRQAVALYWMVSSPIFDQYLSAEQQQQNLELPLNDNPKTREFAQQMYVQSGKQPEVYAQKILTWFHTQGFSYTLSPPILTGQRVDDFLFHTRAGFCEHYAAAFVNLMRMVGIPARIVVGYQGGQYAPDRQSWEVRQLDAHAWTEVWFKNKGWQRIDPTAAIAPERIEMGMQDFSKQNTALFAQSTLTETKLHFITQVRIWADYANYQWQSKVVGFDQNKQRDWLKKWLIDDLSKQLLLLLFFVVCVIGVMVLWLSKQQKVKLSKLDQCLVQYSKHLQKYDLQRLGNEPVLTWFKRIQQQKPSNELSQIIDLYKQHVYVKALKKEDFKRLVTLLKAKNNTINS